MARALLRAGESHARLREQQRQSVSTFTHTSRYPRTRHAAQSQLRNPLPCASGPVTRLGTRVQRPIQPVFIYPRSSTGILDRERLRSNSCSHLDRLPTPKSQPSCLRPKNGSWPSTPSSSPVYNTTPRYVRATQLLSVCTSQRTQPISHPHRSDSCHQVVSNIRNLTASLFGVAAGTLGLESYPGFIFYLVGTSIVSALIFASSLWAIHSLRFARPMQLALRWNALKKML